MNIFVFSDFRNTARDAEEWNASGRLFRTDIVAGPRNSGGPEYGGLEYDGPDPVWEEATYLGNGVAPCKCIDIRQCGHFPDYFGNFDIVDWLQQYHDSCYFR